MAGAGSGGVGGALAGGVVPEAEEATEAAEAEGGAASESDSRKARSRGDPRSDDPPSPERPRKLLSRCRSASRLRAWAEHT